jgi:geranylgeranyl diphosphate synthase type II
MVIDHDGFSKLRLKVEQRLSELVPAGSATDSLKEALRHSLLAPAKRARAILTLVTARELGGTEDSALDFACSIEMVHAASLILDDLPSMDDAELRRGLPANHRIFGEATAILAAIALLNRAYGVIANSDGLSSEKRVEAVKVLDWSVGTEGLVRGQQDDLGKGREHMSSAELEKMYARKTGALFAAAAECGAIAAGQPSLRERMRQFGLDLGVGFQVLDDVLDARGTSDRAGKDVDQDSGRTTFASLLGVKGAATLGRSKIEGALALACSAARDAGSDGRLLRSFAARLASAFSDLMPEFRAELAVNA